MTESELDVVITGYYPDNSKMEGGFKDYFENDLKTLADYVRWSEENSYVSLSVDPKVIALGSLINIEGFNDDEGVPILFYACDKGSKIKGNHVDICCRNEKQTCDVDSDGNTRKLKIIGFER